MTREEADELREIATELERSGYLRAEVAASRLREIAEEHPDLYCHRCGFNHEEEEDEKSSSVSFAKYMGH